LVLGLAAIAAASRLSAQQHIVAPPQRGGQPLPETPYILVTAFHAPTRDLAVEAADELRSRLQSEHTARELYVIPKTTVETTLRSSGYPVDSALGVAELMELGRTLRAEYVIDGTVANAGTNALRASSRVLIKTGQQTLSQPLPATIAKDAGVAARFTERSISESLKQMPGYRDCIAALRTGQYADAGMKARTGITAYSSAVFARVCLLNAYVSAKTAPPDSIIALSNQILAVDSASMLALVNLADAYMAKGDTIKAIETDLKIYRVDPTNAAVAQSIVQQLVSSGAPDKVIPIIDSLITVNPGDVGMVRAKWLLQLRASQWKNAIATGEELAKLDTTAANADYFNRQVGAAQKDSNTAKVVELASKASQKFPKDDSFLLIQAQAYRRMGQLQQALAAARRATDISAQNTNAWLFAAVTANDLQQPDTAAMLAQKGLEAGADKAQLGPILVAPVGAMLAKAQNSKERADWETMFKAAQKVDGTASSPLTKFYVGVSSFQIGLDALQNANKLGTVTGKDAKDSRVKACAETKVAEEMWTTAQTVTPAGARASAETQQAAGQIVGAIQQYSQYIPRMKTQFCGR